MRLLIATEFPPDAPGGGPAVVRQMLRGFPGKVDWWSVHRSHATPSGSVGGWSGEGFKVDRHDHASPGFLCPKRRWTRIRALLMQLGWSYLAAASLRSALAKSRPDRVWVIPHEWSIFPLHQVFNQLWCPSPRVPMHVTIQDFPDTQARLCLLGSRTTKLMASFQESLYQKAQSRDATSLPMLEELQLRTGVPGDQMLHAGLEPKDFAFLQNPPPPKISGAPIRIAYTGTIIVEDEFREFVRILETLRPTLPSGLELCLWSSHTYRYRDWFRPAWMREYGHVSESELRVALRSLDWGFIPMGTTNEDPRYNQFSFPTKFITYLATGLPVISLGHPMSSLMQLTRSYRLGLNFFSKEQMAASLGTELLQERHSRQSCRMEIIRCGKDFFDANQKRTRLWASMGVA